MKRTFWGELRAMEAGAWLFVAVLAIGWILAFFAVWGALLALTGMVTLEAAAWSAVMATIVLAALVKWLPMEDEDE